MKTSTTTLLFLVCALMITTPLVHGDECPFHMDGLGIGHVLLPQQGVVPYYGVEFDAMCTTDVIQWGVQLVGPPDQISQVKLGVQLCQRQGTNYTCKGLNEGKGPFFSGVHQKLSNGSSPMPFLNISLTEDSPANVAFGVFYAVNRVDDFNRVMFESSPRNVIMKKRHQHLLHHKHQQQRKKATPLTSSFVSKKLFSSSTSSSSSSVHQQSPSANIATISFDLNGLNFDSLSTTIENQTQPSDYQFCWNSFNNHMEELQWKTCTSSLAIPPVSNCTDWSTSSAPFFSSLFPANTPVISDAFRLDLVLQSNSTTPFAVAAAAGKVSDVQWLCGKPSARK